MPVFKPDRHRGLVFVGSGISFGAMVGVMAFIGYRADLWLGTKPWLLAAGAMVGVAVGMWDLIRTVRVLERRRDTD